MELLYPQLSYKIIGILFGVHNELGSNYKEVYYQRAIEVHLQKQKIPYKKEPRIDLWVEEQKVGHHFLDFMIDNKIILELKQKPFLTARDRNQLLSYLKSTDLRLGILVSFGSDKLLYERVVNFPKLQ